MCVCVCVCVCERERERERCHFENAFIYFFAAFFPFAFKATVPSELSFA